MAGALAERRPARREDALPAGPVALTEEMAKLTANDRVRARALNVYGLVPVDHVTFIRLPSAPRSEKSSP